MRYALLTLLFLLSSSIAVSAADLTGTWSGKHMPAGDGFPVDPPTAASLTLTQSGSTISGSFTGGEAKGVRIEAVHVVDDKMTFWLRDSQNYLITAQLTVSGNTIRGRMTSSVGRVMNITLRKQ